MRIPRREKMVSSSSSSSSSSTFTNRGLLAPSPHTPAAVTPASTHTTRSKYSPKLLSDDEDDETDTNGLVTPLPMNTQRPLEYSPSSMMDEHSSGSHRIRSKTTLPSSTPELYESFPVGSTASPPPRIAGGTGDASSDSNDDDQQGASALAVGVDAGGGGLTVEVPSPSSRATGISNPLSWTDLDEDRREHTVSGTREGTASVDTMQLLRDWEKEQREREFSVESFPSVATSKMLRHQSSIGAASSSDRGSILFDPFVFSGINPGSQRGSILGSSAAATDIDRHSAVFDHSPLPPDLSPRHLESSVDGSIKEDAASAVSSASGIVLSGGGVSPGFFGGYYYSPATPVRSGSMRDPFGNVTQSSSATSTPGFALPPSAITPVAPVTTVVDSGGKVRIVRKQQSPKKKRSTREEFETAIGRDLSSPPASNPFRKAFTVHRRPFGKQSSLHRGQSPSSSSASPSRTLDSGSVGGGGGSLMMLGTQVPSLPLLRDVHSAGPPVSDEDDLKKSHPKDSDVGHTDLGGLDSAIDSAIDAALRTQDSGTVNGQHSSPRKRYLDRGRPKSTIPAVAPPKPVRLTTHDSELSVTSRTDSNSSFETEDLSAVSSDASGAAGPSSASAKAAAVSAKGDRRKRPGRRHRNRDRRLADIAERSAGSITVTRRPRLVDSLSDTDKRRKRVSRRLDVSLSRPLTPKAAPSFRPGQSSQTRSLRLDLSSSDDDSGDDQNGLGVSSAVDILLSGVPTHVSPQTSPAHRRSPLRRHSLAAAADRSSSTSRLRNSISDRSESAASRRMSNHKRTSSEGDATLASTLASLALATPSPDHHDAEEGDSSSSTMKGGASVTTPNQYGLTLPTLRPTSVTAKRSGVAGFDWFVDAMNRDRSTTMESESDKSGLMTDQMVAPFALQSVAKSMFASVTSGSPASTGGALTPILSGERRKKMCSQNQSGPECRLFVRCLDLIKRELLAASKKSISLKQRRPGSVHDSQSAMMSHTLSSPTRSISSKKSVASAEMSCAVGLRGFGQFIRSVLDCEVDQFEFPKHPELMRRLSLLDRNVNADGKGVTASAVSAEGESAVSSPGSGSARRLARSTSSSSLLSLMNGHLCTLNEMIDDKNYNTKQIQKIFEAICKENGSWIRDEKVISFSDFVVDIKHISHKLTLHEDSLNNVMDPTLKSQLSLDESTEVNLFKHQESFTSLKRGSSFNELVNNDDFIRWCVKHSLLRKCDLLLGIRELTPDQLSPADMFLSEDEDEANSSDSSSSVILSKPAEQEEYMDEDDGAHLIEESPRLLESNSDTATVQPYLPFASVPVFKAGGRSRSVTHSIPSEEDGSINERSRSGIQHPLLPLKQVPLGGSPDSEGSGNYFYTSSESGDGGERHPPPSGGSGSGSDGGGGGLPPSDPPMGSGSSNSGNSGGGGDDPRKNQSDDGRDEEESYDSAEDESSSEGGFISDSSDEREGPPEKHPFIQRNSISWSGDGTERGVWPTLCNGDLVHLTHERKDVGRMLIGEISEVRTIDALLPRGVRKKRFPRTRAGREAQKEATLYRVGFPSVVTGLYSDVLDHTDVAVSGFFKGGSPMGSASVSSFGSTPKSKRGRRPRQSPGGYSTDGTSSPVSVMSLPDFVKRDIDATVEMEHHFTSFFHGPVYLSTFQLPQIDKIDASDLGPAGNRGLLLMEPGMGEGSSEEDDSSETDDSSFDDELNQTISGRVLESKEKKPKKKRKKDRSKHREKNHSMGEVIMDKDGKKKSVSQQHSKSRSLPPLLMKASRLKSLENQLSRLEEERETWANLESGHIDESQHEESERALVRFIQKNSRNPLLRRMNQNGLINYEQFSELITEQLMIPNFDDTALRHIFRVLYSNELPPDLPPPAKIGVISIREGSKIVTVDWDNLNGMFITYSEVFNDWDLDMFLDYYGQSSDNTNNNNNHRNGLMNDTMEDGVLSASTSLSRATAHTSGGRASSRSSSTDASVIGGAASAKGRTTAADSSSLFEPGTPALFKDDGDDEDYTVSFKPGVKKFDQLLEHLTMCKLQEIYVELGFTNVDVHPNAFLRKRMSLMGHRQQGEVHLFFQEALKKTMKHSQTRYSNSTGSAGGGGGTAASYASSKTTNSSPTEEYIHPMHRSRVSFSRRLSGGDEAKPVPVVVYPGAKDHGREESTAASGFPAVPIAAGSGGSGIPAMMHRRESNLSGYIPIPLRPAVTGKLKELCGMVPPPLAEPPKREMLTHDGGWTLHTNYPSLLHSEGVDVPYDPFNANAQREEANLMFDATPSFHSRKQPLDSGTTSGLSVRTGKLDDISEDSPYLTPIAHSDHGGSEDSSSSSSSETVKLTHSQAKDPFDQAKQLSVLHSARDSMSSTHASSIVRQSSGEAQAAVAAVAASLERPSLIEEEASTDVKAPPKRGERYAHSHPKFANDERSSLPTLDENSTFADRARIEASIDSSIWKLVSDLFDAIDLQKKGFVDEHKLRMGTLLLGVVLTRDQMNAIMSYICGRPSMIQLGYAAMASVRKLRDRGHRHHHSSTESMSSDEDESHIADKPRPALDQIHSSSKNSRRGGLDASTNPFHYQSSEDDTHAGGVTGDHHPFVVTKGQFALFLSKPVINASDSLAMTDLERSRVKILANLQAKAHILFGTSMPAKRTLFTGDDRAMAATAPSVKSFGSTSSRDKPPPPHGHSLDHHPGYNHLHIPGAVELERDSKKKKRDKRKGQRSKQRRRGSNGSSVQTFSTVQSMAPIKGSVKISGKHRKIILLAFYFAIRRGYEKSGKYYRSSSSEDGPTATMKAWSDVFKSMSYNRPYLSGSALTKGLKNVCNVKNRDSLMRELENCEDEMLMKHLWVKHETRVPRTHLSNPKLMMKLSKEKRRWLKKGRKKQRKRLDDCCVKVLQQREQFGWLNLVYVLFAHLDRDRKQKVLTESAFLRFMDTHAGWRVDYPDLTTASDHRRKKTGSLRLKPKREDHSHSPGLESESIDEKQREDHDHYHSPHHRNQRGGYHKVNNHSRSSVGSVIRHSREMTQSSYTRGTPFGAGLLNDEDTNDDSFLESVWESVNDHHLYTYEEAMKLVSRPAGSTSMVTGVHHSRDVTGVSSKGRKKNGSHHQKGGSHPAAVLVSMTSNEYHPLSMDPDEHDDDEEDDDDGNDRVNEEMDERYERDRVHRGLQQSTEDAPLVTESQFHGLFKRRIKTRELRERKTGQGWTVGQHGEYLFEIWRLPKSMLDLSYRGYALVLDENNPEMVAISPLRNSAAQCESAFVIPAWRVGTDYSMKGVRINTAQGPSHALSLSGLPSSPRTQDNTMSSPNHSNNAAEQSHQYTCVDYVFRSEEAFDFCNKVLQNLNKAKVIQRGRKRKMHGSLMSHNANGDDSMIRPIREQRIKNDDRPSLVLTDTVRDKRPTVHFSYFWMIWAVIIHVSFALIAMVLASNAKNNGRQRKRSVFGSHHLNSVLTLDVLMVWIVLNLLLVRPWFLNRVIRPFLMRMAISVRFSPQQSRLKLWCHQWSMSVVGLHSIVSILIVFWCLLKLLVTITVGIRRMGLVWCVWSLSDCLCFLLFCLIHANLSRASPSDHQRVWRFLVEIAGDVCCLMFAMEAMIIRPWISQPARSSSSSLLWSFSFIFGSFYMRPEFYAGLLLLIELLMNRVLMMLECCDRCRCCGCDERCVLCADCGDETVSSDESRVRWLKYDQCELTVPWSVSHFDMMRIRVGSDWADPWIRVPVLLSTQGLRAEYNPDTIRCDSARMNRKKGRKLNQNALDAIHEDDDENDHRRRRNEANKNRKSRKHDYQRLSNGWVELEEFEDEKVREVDLEAQRKEEKQQRATDHRSEKRRTAKKKSEVTHTTSWLDQRLKELDNHKDESDSPPQWCSLMIEGISRASKQVYRRHCESHFELLPKTVHLRRYQTTTHMGYFLQSYQELLIVASDGGIAPVISFVHWCHRFERRELLQNTRIIWYSNDPRKQYALYFDLLFSMHFGMPHQMVNALRYQGQLGMSDLIRKELANMGGLNKKEDRTRVGFFLFCSPKMARDVCGQFKHVPWHTTEAEWEYQ